MAKLPKKKPAKPVAPKKSMKPAPKPTTKAKVTAKPKAGAKPKPNATPKPVNKPKAAPKPKAVAKQPKKPAVTTTKSTKPKPATKAPKKPVKPAAGLSLMGADLSLEAAGTGLVGNGAAAVPQITSPAANAAVPAGVNLTVTATTNRSDFGYIIELTDITPPGPPPAPVQIPVAAPAGSPFSKTIPGANLAPGRTYQIRVLVDPTSGGTPPNGDITITVTT